MSLPRLLEKHLSRVSLSRPRVVPLGAAILVTALAAAPLLAGSLTPPGPPAPTMKPLDQVETRTPISTLPFTISASGSYYLTKNLTATVSGLGISVQASPVTIDLNGFTLDGANWGPGAYGIYHSSGGGDLTIRNGFIRRWDTGINANMPGLLRVEGVTVANNTGTGVVVTVAEVTNCKIVFNGGDGLSSGYTLHVRDTLVSDNHGVGIAQTGPHTLIENSRILSNFLGGVYLGRNSTLRDSMISENGGYGLHIEYRVLVAGNEIDGNLGDGIATTSVIGDSRIEGNTVTSNSGIGIRSTSGGNFIVRNSARGNSGGNYLISGAGNVAPIETGTITNAASNVSY